MTFLKDNWFKIALVTIIGYGVVAGISAYEDYPAVQAYQQMRYKTFATCMDLRVPPDADSNAIKLWQNTCLP